MRRSDKRDTEVLMRHKGLALLLIVIGLVGCDRDDGGRHRRAA